MIKPSLFIALLLVAAAIAAESSEPLADAASADQITLLEAPVLANQQPAGANVDAETASVDDSAGDEEQVSDDGGDDDEDLDGGALAAL